MSVVCRVEKSIGGPAMTVDGFCVCACSAVNRQRSEVPVGLSHRKLQNLAIRRQAGDKQSICWLFPVVTVHN